MKNQKDILAHIIALVIIEILWTIGIWLFRNPVSVFDNAEKMAFIFLFILTAIGIAFIVRKLVRLRKGKIRVYVASSWRNPHQPEVVKALRELGYEVYDFRNPPENPGGFAWSRIDENWQNWSLSEYIAGLEHPLAQKGFKADFDAMCKADACVLVLPCGRSAHAEAGWIAGAGKKVIAYIPEMKEPELMYKIFDGMADTIEGVSELLKK